MLHHPSTSRSFANRQRFLGGEEKIKRGLSSFSGDQQTNAFAAADAAAAVTGDNKGGDDYVADDGDCDNSGHGSPALSMGNIDDHNKKPNTNYRYCFAGQCNQLGEEVCICCICLHFVASVCLLSWFALVISCGEQILP